MRTKNLLILMVLLLTLMFLLPSRLMASVPDDVNLKLKSTDVFVFKNGIDFILKSGKVSGFNGTAVTDDTPEALMGSLITYVDDKDAKIKSVTSYTESVDVENDISSICELIDENVGKKVKVGYGASFGKDMVTVTGTLEMAGCDFIIVKKGDESEFIRTSDIKSFSMLEEVDKKVSSEKKEPRLKFDILSKKSDLNISMGYLRRGIRWIPLYKVDLLPGGRARVTLDAQIINDGEDVASSNFYLVVGAPNFRYSDMRNPFVLKSVASYALTGAMNSSFGNWDNRALSNSLMTQVSNMSNDMTTPVPLEEVPAGYEDSELGGVKNEDTFVYEVKDVSLKNGARMMVNLFSAEVTYEDIYKVDMADKFTSSDGHSSSSSLFLPGQDNKVWHNLRLKNITSYPWTTGVATVFKDSVPISQDMMKYTPRGTDYDLPLMIASDIFVHEKGDETDRDRIKLANTHKEYYDKVTVKSVIKITNAKERDIKLEVKKSFYGDDIDAENYGEVTKSPEYLTRVNPNANIKWILKLKGKQKIEFGYGFTTLIRR